MVNEGLREPRYFVVRQVIRYVVIIRHAARKKTMQQGAPLELGLRRGSRTGIVC